MERQKPKNVFYQPSKVSIEERQSILDQKGCVLWITGLSGAGKSTIATALERKLTDEKRMSYVLDGDNVRSGLNNDLTFSETDRKENIRRIAEVSTLFCNCGIICLSAFISPFREEREFARSIVGDQRFFEIYISTPIEECERRDVKGLYKKARDGEIPNFTGISSPYEPPESPALSINTLDIGIDESVNQIIAMLESKGMLSDKA